MKHIAKILSIAVATTLSLGACNMDNVNYDDKTHTPADNIGYLQLGGLEASVMEETDNISSTTRANELDINTFDVVIKNSNNQEVAAYKYGELPAEAIALEAGTYTIEMSSQEMDGAAWETPVYGAKRTVIITRKETTTVNDIICKLQNIKVTVGYSADILEQLDMENTSMEVALEESALTFAASETRAGYFTPVAASNTLKLTFTCRYKGETKDIVMTNELKNVKAAQWRKINVVVQHAADGTATLGIVCDTWTYDEEVTFDTSVMLMEEVLTDDTDMPVIAWEGHDLNEPFELTDEMFDANGNFTSSINIDITSKAAINSIVIKASSDNTDFNTAYSEIMPLETDICNGTVSNALLKLMGYPTDAKGVKSTRLKFAAQADMLHSYEGTHSYEITVTDDNGAKTSATLTVKYGQNITPQIIWVGYNIDERQTITSETTCKIRITAPLTIKNFEIEIISNSLTPEELTAVGLASKFSLVNDTQFFDSLSGLGFPVGDQVYGKTVISEDQLDITQFLSVLGMFGAGNHDFVMTVTDMEGNVTTKSVMLHYEQQ